MNERPHVVTSWNAVNILGCRCAIIARIRVRGSPCRRKDIWQHVLPSRFSVYYLVYLVSLSRISEADAGLDFPLSSRSLRRQMTRSEGEKGY